MGCHAGGAEPPVKIAGGGPEARGGEGVEERAGSSVQRGGEHWAVGCTHPREKRHKEITAGAPAQQTESTTGISGRETQRPM